MGVGHRCLTDEGFSEPRSTFRIAHASTIGTRSGGVVHASSCRPSCPPVADDHVAEFTCRGCARFPQPGSTGRDRAHQDASMHDCGAAPTAPGIRRQGGPGEASLWPLRYSGWTPAAGRWHFVYQIRRWSRCADWQVVPREETVAEGQRAFRFLLGRRLRPRGEVPRSSGLSLFRLQRLLGLMPARRPHHHPFSNGVRSSRSVGQS